MSNQALAEVDQYQTELFSILRRMAKNTDPAANSAALRKAIPIADIAIQKYKTIIGQFKFEERQSINHILQARLDAFKDHQLNSLDMYFTRSYNHLNNIVTTVGKQTDDLKRDYQLEVTNAQNELKLLKLDKEREFEERKKDAQKQHEETMDKLQKEIDSITQSSKTKVDQETKRVVDHFEKQLAVKEESRVMLISAINKAQQELVEATKEREAELAVIVEKNNQNLESHRAKLEDKTQQLANELHKLELEYEDLKKSQMNLGSELDEKWKKRSEELEQQFKLEEDRLAEEISFHTQTVTKLKDDISSLEIDIESMKKESIENQNSQMSQLETKLKEEEQKQNMKLNEVKKEITKKYEWQLAELESNLEQVKQSIEDDMNEYQSKAAIKQAKHQERVNKIKKEHAEKVNNIKLEIKAVNDEIKQTKDDWEVQRKEIRENYDKDVNDISQKESDKDVYFEAKLAALKKELNLITEETELLQRADDTIDENDEEISSTQKVFIEDEKELATDLSKNMDQKVSEKVNEKMNLLRQKHEKERENLLLEARKLEEQEAALKLKLAEEEKKSQEESQKTPEQMFQSSTIMDVQIDKWRESYFVETKKLKQEEIEALKQLDSCKVNFKEAVFKTIELKEQLKKSTEEYEEALQKAKSKGSEELEGLRQIVEAKEKEINLLEKQFEANEKEVRKKIILIEEAEDKLNALRTKLDEEKTKIKEVIKNEFQPLISQEQKKSEQKVSELEKLRNELELSVEYMKHDLYGIEASNAALEEELKKETEKMVAELHEELLTKYEKEEADLMEKFEQIEMEKEEEAKNEAIKLEAEVTNFKLEKDAEMESQKKKCNEQISALNDECLNILKKNTEKKQLIQELKERDCDLCPVLDKNMKKLEKIIVKMQIQDRDLMLDSQNKRETISKLGQKTKLPTLPTTPS